MNPGPRWQRAAFQLRLRGPFAAYAACVAYARRHGPTPAAIRPPDQCTISARLLSSWSPQSFEAVNLDCDAAAPYDLNHMAPKLAAISVTCLPMAYSGVRMNKLNDVQRQIVMNHIGHKHFDRDYQCDRPPCRHACAPTHPMQGMIGLISGLFRNQSQAERPPSQGGDATKNG